MPTGRTETPRREWAEMVGGTWAGNPPQTFHAPRHLFTVKFTDHDHPIAPGMKEAFQTLDGLYHAMRFLPGAHIIATAYDDPAIGGTGPAEPVLVTVNFGKGRVFYNALGHVVPGIEEPGFAIPFVRGAEWAATGGVTLPPRFPENRTPTRRRDVSTVVTGNPDAYVRDLRKEADVLLAPPRPRVEVSDGMVQYNQ